MVEEGSSKNAGEWAGQAEWQWKHKTTKAESEGGKG